MSPSLPAAHRRRTGARIAVPNRARSITALVIVAVGSLSACSAAQNRVVLDVPAARAPSAQATIGEDVARLLSPDPIASESAARVLSGLDDDRRKALAAHAAKIPQESDPRWLTVLDQNGLWTEQRPALRADLLAWQASQKDRRLVWRAQSGLLDLARSHPEVLLQKLADPTCPARDAIALSLADAGEKRAIPVLVGLYLSPRVPAERRAASIALGRLAGDERRPRLEATEVERSRDATTLLAWYKSTGGSDAKR